MKNIFLFFLLLMSNYTFSQRVVFVDKDLKNVDSLTYKRTCKNSMLKCYSITKNDTIFNVVYNKYKFGKLSHYEYKRIHDEIYRNSNFKGTIIIHYGYNNRSLDEIQKQRIDNYYNKKLPNSTIPDSIKYSQKNIKALNKVFSGYSIIKKLIIKEGEQKSKRINKCIKKLKHKHDVDVLHYYFEGNPEYTHELDWIKDSNHLIRNYFFKFFANYHYVILKEDGQFFQIGGLITPKNIKKLLKTDDWSKYIQDLDKSYKRREPVGFFNMPHIHTCL